MEGDSGLVPRWRHLYRGVVQTSRQAHLLPGASLPDPAKLFNSGLEGNTRRAIDIREGEKLNQAAFRKLIRAAVAISKPQAVGP